MSNNVTINAVRRRIKKTGMDLISHNSLSKSLKEYYHCYQSWIPMGVYCGDHVSYRYILLGGGKYPPLPSISAHRHAYGHLAIAICLHKPILAISEVECVAGRNFDGVAEKSMVEEDIYHLLKNLIEISLRTVNLKGAICVGLLLDR